MEKTIDSLVVGNLGNTERICHKFIVSQEDCSLVYNSIPFSGEVHLEVAIANQIPKEQILGGGMARLEETTLRMYSESRGFGGVPLNVLRSFGPSLLKAYLHHHPKLDSVLCGAPKSYRPHWDTLQYKNGLIIPLD